MQYKALDWTIINPNLFIYSNQFVLSMYWGPGTLCYTDLVLDMKENKGFQA